MKMRVIAGIFCTLLLGGVYQAEAADVISTVGGNGTPAFSGDSGAALSASFNNPSSVALDAAGNILVADRDNNRIRRIDVSTGIVTTIAGNGTAAFAGDRGTADVAAINAPGGIATLNGDIYIADTGNHRIRKITAATNIIQTIAGNGTGAFAGDSLIATGASLNSPQGVFVDAAGNVFIADTGNNRVRKIDALTNIITTIAGTGTAGASGDGAAATAAQLNGLVAVTVDAAGIVFVSDSKNHRVRRIDAQNNISTFAGNGTAALAGDNGAASSASLNLPGGIALDGSKNLIIADSANNRVRKVDAISNTITTIAGTAAGFGGDGSDPVQAALTSPAAVVVSASNVLYIADQGNQRIRKISTSTASNLSIVSVTATPNPVRTTEATTFTAAATQAQGKALTFTWNFGDKSATATGQSVSHAYVAEGMFTAVVTVTDNVESVAGSTTVEVLGPNSGADGQSNVSVGKTVTNPVDGTSITVPAANGGVVDFSASTKTPAALRATSQFNIFIDDGISTTPIKGSAAAHKFQKSGIFITTTQIMDTATKTMTGQMRKTVAISDRELGISKLKKPDANDISGIKMKGKFMLNGGIKNDTITFTGRFELPGGLDVSQPLPVTVSIGNIVDSLTVDKRGKGAIGSAGLVSGLTVKYPAISRKNPILPPQQFATISWKVSGSGLSKRGADTEGISLDTPSAKSKTGAPLSVQVLLSVGGESYERLVPVNFIVSKDNEFGTIQGRK